jgi:translation initiation factor IF-1
MSDSKNDKLLTARGVVTEALPSTLFRVKMESTIGVEEGAEILAYLSGKMRMHRIKVLIGDSVEIVLDPYGGKGRIIKRL